MDIYSGYKEMVNNTVDPATQETVTPEPQTADTQTADTEGTV